jgi:hypothetical protein
MMLHVCHCRDKLIRHTSDLSGRRFFFPLFGAFKFPGQPLDLFPVCTIESFVFNRVLIRCTQCLRHFQFLLLARVIDFEDLLRCLQVS